jgi:hypothetical protein
MSLQEQFKRQASEFANVGDEVDSCALNEEIKMELNLRRSILGLIGAGTISLLTGFAMAEPNSKVYHGLQIEVNKSVGMVLNIRYTYGSAFVNETLPSAGSFAAFENYTAPMLIPDEFEISWETQDGKKHQANVPVRSRLPGSVENKSVIFVIMPDHVEGYVGVFTPYGQKRERFY